MRLRLFLGLLAVGALFLGTANAQVNPQGQANCTSYVTTLVLTSTPTAGVCLVSGDKVFWNIDTDGPFTITATAIGNGVDTGSPQFDTHTGLYGIQFAGAIVSTTDFLDFHINYDVETASDSGMLIHDITQLANLAGPAGSSITELAVASNDSSNFGRSTVTLTDIGDPPGETFQSDQLIFGTPIGFPNFVSVNKDIQLLNGSTNAPVTLSTIQQRFSQIPEPRDYALMLGLGLALMIWRKRATAV
ncbi:MAG: hypothetical protein LAP38_03985 [Acidobacteriia bacterium]|nr:hypothetical protein [Terriglobia bacterium]